MKSLKLKKLVAAALTIATISAVSPMAASAAWKQDNRGWWNTEGNSYSIGWRQLNGSWFHFDSVGYMSTGWVQDGQAWYYMNPVSDGTMGSMKTGWIQDKGTWYYLNPVSNGSQGAMSTGWINDNGTWYFTDNSGAMQTGVVEVDGKVYYLQSSGAMATGTVEINGTKYTFDASGACVGDTPKVDKAFNSNGTIVNSGSTNNNTGSSNSGNSSSSGSSSSGGGGSSSIEASINESYRSYAKLEKVADKDNTYKFTEDSLKSVEESDYVTRDIYVTGAKKVTKEGGNFVIEPQDGNTKVVVKGVVRVVRDGVIYYVTSEIK